MNQFAKDVLRKCYDIFEVIKQNRQEFLYAFLAFILSLTASFMMSGEVIHLLESRVPYEVTFSQTMPEEMFLNLIKMTVLMGVFISLPFFLYRFMKIKIENYDKQKKLKLIKFLLSATLMCILGTLFAYYITIPIHLFFLLGLNFNAVEINMNISSYLSFCFGSIILSCMLFQLPLIYFLVKKDKFYTYEELKPYNKYIFSIAGILAFIILLPPELLSLLVLTVSITIFYWIVLGMVKKSG